MLIMTSVPDQFVRQDYMIGMMNMNPVNPVNLRHPVQTYLVTLFSCFDFREELIAHLPDGFHVELLAFKHYLPALFIFAVL